MTELQPTASSSPCGGGKASPRGCGHASGLIVCAGSRIIVLAVTPRATAWAMLKPMNRLVILLATAGLALGFAQAAPERIVFWHYVADGESNKTLQVMAKEFNAGQSKYEVTPQSVGGFSELAVKTIAAARANNLPTMALVDNAFFNRLAFGGLLADLSVNLKELPKATMQDFYPVLWDYGAVNAKRFGLPWAASTLVLFYNQNAFAAKGLKPPSTWDEFTADAKAMTTHASKGVVLISDAWQFSSVVAGRGGMVLASNSKPDLSGQDFVGTLSFLQKLVKGGQAIPRSLSEINVALMDFLRTKAMMVIAPTSAWPMANGYSVGFKLGVAPLPGRTVAGEGQLVVFKSASGPGQKGAVEFWKYLTRPENIVRWSKVSGYLPARRSVAKDFSQYGDKAQVIQAGMSALDKAFNLPKMVDFETWRLNLEGALDKVLKGGAEPSQALAEAQRLSAAGPDNLK